MANSYYPISITNFTISEIASALTAKYGTDITIHYTSTTDIIFTCSALSTKVIRIYYNTGYQTLYAYYGDSWTSTTTITNSVQFLNSYTNNAPSARTIDMVLGTSFMLINLIDSNAYRNSQLLIIGKATNGDSMVFGLWAGYQGQSIQLNCLCRDITLNVPINLKTFDGGFTMSQNKIAKFPLIIVQNESGTLMTNVDGTQATIPDLYISSYKTTQNSNVLTSNSLITSCQFFSESLNVRMQTGLIAEW